MTSSVHVLPLTPNQLLGNQLTPLRAKIEVIVLQVGHRMAAIAIFATLAAWAMLYQGQDDRWAVVVAFAAADLGLCAAIVAGTAVRRFRRETLGVFIVNLLLVALSMQTMLFNRLDFFRSAIEKFFTPS